MKTQNGTKKLPAAMILAEAMFRAKNNFASPEDKQKYSDHKDTLTSEARKILKVLENNGYELTEI